VIARAAFVAALALTASTAGLPGAHADDLPYTQKVAPP
jgi:hypothetical protein